MCFTRLSHSPPLCDAVIEKSGGIAARCNLAGKLGQNLGEESTPNRVEIECRGAQESSNQQQVRLTVWAHNPKIGGLNPPPRNHERHCQQSSGARLRVLFTLRYDEI